MGIVKIDGNLLKKMIISGANALDKNKDSVDALNVFPVPDGDTGTNMSLTFLAAAREAEKVESPNVYDVAKAVSSGSLRGARGNSGVILSQLFRGFAKGLEGCDVATADDIANAFIKASETAYKAVMKPKEGTILTIAKAMAEKAVEVSFDTDDVEELLIEILDHTKDVLNRTTEMLPALKQAGVVDAGGQGLLIIWEAALLSLQNKDDTVELLHSSSSPAKNNIIIDGGYSNNIKFVYCTEFFIYAKKFGEEIENHIKNYLSRIGDSIVVVTDDDVIKIHVHTNNPGQVLEKALRIGYLDSIKIENMKIQHSSMINFSKSSNVITKESTKTNTLESSDNIENKKKDLGFIIVSAGKGFCEVFENLGADMIIEGGQTMNPSTEDFLSAIENLNCNNIIIMPNNKNIILAAEQVNELVDDKNIFVLPSRSIPQGITALVNYNENKNVEENFKEMKEIITTVNSGQITHAVRDTVIDNKEIKKDDILCIYNGKIELVEKEMQQGTKRLIDYMINEGGEILTIFYGESATKDDANELLSYVNKKYKDVEVEIQHGGQPLYNYILSIE